MNTKSWRFRSLVGASTIAVSAVVALGATGMGSEVFAAGANHGPAALTPGAGTHRDVHRVGLGRWRSPLTRHPYGSRQCQ
jgi:hypothetical protein